MEARPLVRYESRAATLHQEVWIRGASSVALQGKPAAADLLGRLLRQGHGAVSRSLKEEETPSRSSSVQISRCASLVQQIGEKMAVHEGGPLSILGYAFPTVFDDVPVR